MVSVASVLQKGVTELAVLDSSDIKRPKDLDGRLYAGFGLPYEEPLIKTVITSDGGKGTFRTATLSTARLRGAVRQARRLHGIFTTWRASRPTSAASSCAPSGRTSSACRTTRPSS